MTADFALRADRVWRLVGLGDGQVRDRPVTIAPRTFLAECLRSRLRRRNPAPPPHRDPSLARDLRALLDEHSVAGITLAQAGRILYADPAHLVRAFSREFGIAPHRYLIGRRIDLARRLLLAGRRPADVAVAAGFHDQSHLNRHFKRMIGATPKQFASSYPARTPDR